MTRSAPTVILSSILVIMGCRSEKIETTKPAAKAIPLEVTQIDLTHWTVDFSGVIGTRYQFRFTRKAPNEKMKTNRTTASKAVRIGDTFFDKEPGKHRFRLLEIKEEIVDEEFGEKIQRRAVIEDLKPGKQGKRYLSPYQTRKADLLKRTHTDAIAHLKYNKDMVTLEEGIPLKFKENTLTLTGFSLSEDKSKATDITVTIQNGEQTETRTLKVP